MTEEVTHLKGRIRVSLRGMIGEITLIEEKMTKMVGLAEEEIEEVTLIEETLTEEMAEKEVMIVERTGEITLIERKVKIQEGVQTIDRVEEMIRDTILKVWCKFCITSLVKMLLL